MAAPSKPFTPISDEQVDANSPVDELLMTSVRDSLVSVSEQISDGFTAAKAHRHNNIDSAAINEGDIVKVDTVSIFDDFFSLADWKLIGSGATFVADGENGIIAIVATTGGVYDGIRTFAKPFKLDGNQINYEIRIKDTAPAEQADTYILGLVDTDPPGTPGGDPVNGIYIDKDAGASNLLKSVTVSGGILTINVWDIAPDDTYKTLRIEATPTSVEFFADGVSKAIHTTNIPGTSTLLAAAAWARMGSVVPRSYDVDYIDIKMDNRF